MPKKRVRIRTQNIKISKYKIPACYQLYYSIVKYAFIFYLLYLVYSPTAKIIKYLIKLLDQDLIN